MQARATRPRVESAPLVVVGLAGGLGTRRSSSWDSPAGSDPRRISSFAHPMRVRQRPAAQFRHLQHEVLAIGHGIVIRLPEERSGVPDPTHARDMRIRQNSGRPPLVPTLAHGASGLSSGIVT
jgi:hypothetical protein